MHHGTAERTMWEFTVAACTVLAVALAVGAAVFGLIVVLYDLGQPVPRPAIGVALTRR